MAAATDQAVADLLADINTMSAAVDAAEAELSALPAALTVRITEWSQSEQVKRSAWNTDEVRGIEHFKSQLLLVVSAYTTKLRAHLRALAPDATHNGQADPATRVTQFPEWYRVRNHRFSTFPGAGKVPGTWQPGYAGGEVRSEANSSPALCSPSAAIAPGATVVGAVDEITKSAAVNGARYLHSAVTLTVASDVSVTVKVYSGSTLSVADKVDVFNVEPGIALFDAVRLAKSGVDDIYPYFKVSVTNNDTAVGASVTITVDKALESDPVICFRPLFTGFTREECPVPNSKVATATRDRYVIGQPWGRIPVIGGWPNQVNPRTTWWACTPYNKKKSADSHGNIITNPGGQPVGQRGSVMTDIDDVDAQGRPASSTTGSAEYAASSYAIRLDAPAKGCGAVENRMYVPISPTGSQT